MLAAVPQDIPLREHSHLDIQHTNTLALDDRVCPGCKKSAVNEQGGLVVAFG
jgi:Rho-type GTPase-activating protein 1/2